MTDCHTHTLRSPRGEHSALQMCKIALSKGVSVLGITDHCECNRYYPREFYTENPNSFDSYDNRSLFLLSMSDIAEAKAAYGGKLTVLCGTELGQATFDLEAAEKVISDKRLDYVIGSMHQIPCCDDFCGLKFSSPELVQIQLERYFKEVLKLCRWGKFNVLGHLTYPLRYIEGNFGVKVDIARYYDIIKMIFQTITDKGIALEINCSGLRQSYGKTFPTADILRLYKDSGGSFVSIGSDAHSGNDMAYGFDTAAELALSCGIECGVYFMEGRPFVYSLRDKK